MLESVFDSFGSKLMKAAGELISQVLNIIRGGSRFEIARKKSIEGRWSGVLSQKVQEQDVALEFDIVMTVRRNRVRAKIHFQAVEKTSVDAIGEFSHQDYLVLSYKSEELELKQFGAIVCQLTALGDVLNGKFIGYGPFNESIVDGDFPATKR